MRIVHICLCSPYTDGWGYQENILPRIQQSMGHEVIVVATCTSFSKTNSTEIVEVEPKDYYLDDGVRVIRVLPKKYLFLSAFDKVLPNYDIFALLCKLSPEVVLVHGMGTYGRNDSIKRFAQSKHAEKCFFVGDTHKFLEIAPRARTIKHKFLQMMHDREIKALLPYFKKIYGITPDCIEYAKEYYAVDDERISLLPLGYDPTMIRYEDRSAIREAVRKKYKIHEENILIVHGGKITKRRRTEKTIASFEKINKENNHISLIVFGALAKECEKEVSDLIENSDSVIYIGNQKQEDYLNLFLAADLGVFPGGQSVLWQEAIGCGLPLVLGKANNIEYLNRGGNVLYVDGANVDSIANGVRLAINNLGKMSAVARSNAREYFSYERIARQIDDDAEEWFKSQSS